MRPPVIIVGSHRSGTSAVTSALRSLGLFLGEPQECDHHDESRFFLALHEEYLKRLGASWHDPGALLHHISTPQGRQNCRAWLRFRTEGRLGGHFALVRRFAAKRRWLALLAGREAWGWKDPRTSLFLPVWLEIFPDARVLHLVRHPLDVALSLQKRERKWLAEKRPYAANGRDSLAEWLDLVKIYVEAVSMAKPPHLKEMRFEDVQRNPVEKLGELAEFCGLNASGAAISNAAATIDATRTARWKELPGEEIAHLLENFAPAARFGYGALESETNT